MPKEEAIEVEGTVIEPLPNAMFRVELGIDDVADARDLVLGEGVRPRVGRNLRLTQNLPGRCGTDPVNIGQRRPDLLRFRNVDSGYPCQTYLLPTRPGSTRSTLGAACVSDFRK